MIIKSSLPMLLIAVLFAIGEIIRPLMCRVCRKMMWMCIYSNESYIYCVHAIMYVNVSTPQTVHVVSSIFNHQNDVDLFK